MNLLAPAGLLLGALAIPLVSLYFLKLRRRRVVVPSLLPWQALQRIEQLQSPFQRFRRNLLLLVQLALLALLTAALARPAIDDAAGGARSLVLVLDTTASMATRDVPEGTRLDAARARARALVDGLQAGDEALVVVAGASTEVVQPFTADRAALRRALDAVAPTEAPGGLETALSLAASVARGRPDVEIVVLSDGGPNELSAAPVDGGLVRFAPIGTTDANCGLVALDLRRSPSSDLVRQLFVTAACHGREPADGAVEVWLEGELLGLRTVQVAPDAPQSVVFDLDAAASGDLEVRLRVTGDPLAADDRAWAVVDPSGERRVLLVGADPLVARILAADPRVDAQVVAPALATPELLRSADCVVFAGPVPDGVDGLSYAVLGPWDGSPVRFGAPVKAPRITSWQRTHPLLHHGAWDPVVVAEARAVADAAGLSPIVEGDRGPLVLAGTRAGGRVVQLAFDPARSDLPLRVAWPVFVLDAVGWLTQDAALLGAEAGGSAIRTGAGLVRAVDPAATEATLDGPDHLVAPVREGILRVPGLDRAGVWRVRAGGTTLRLAANLLSESETRIRPRPSLGLVTSGGDAVAEAAIGGSRRELWRPLVLLGFAVALGEWLLWNLRRVA